MCGRYSITTPLEAMRQLFHFDGSPNLAPRYNVAPTQSVPVVRRKNGGRELVLLRWGLIPSWAKDARIGASLINARGETVQSKPAFRSAFAKRRCLVLADSFYEWQKRGSAKQPWRIMLADGAPFGFAGLWESWHSTDGDILQTCSIITTEANDLTRPIHERMPVILDAADHARWLDPTTLLPELALLLKPYPAAGMQAYPITTRINAVKNDDADCLTPLADGKLLL